MISIYYFLGFFSIIIIYFGLIVRSTHFCILVVGVLYGFFASRTVVEGTDIAVYRNIFLQMQGDNFIPYNYDMLFWILMDIFASMGASFELFYFAVTTIIIVLLLKTAKYFSRTSAHFLAFAALFFVSTAFFFFQQNIIRQGLAAALLAPLFFAPTALLRKKYYFRGVFVPIHFSSVFAFVVRSKFLTALFAGILIWLALSLPLPGDIWIVTKALRLLDKDYSPVIFLLSSVLSFFIYKRSNDTVFLHISICLVVLFFLPYIGYRLLFYLQGPLLLGFVNICSARLILPVALFCYFFGGVIFFMHPSILKLSYVIMDY